MLTTYCKEMYKRENKIDQEESPREKIINSLKAEFLNETVTINELTSLLREKNYSLNDIGEYGCNKELEFVREKNIVVFTVKKIDRNYIKVIKIEMD